MNDQDTTHFDARIADWLEGDPNAAPDQALQIVLAAVPSIRQLPGSRRPWRYPVMRNNQWLAAAVGVIALGAIGLAVLQPGLISGPAGKPSPASSPSQALVASPSPARAGPIALPRDVELAPGGYSIGGTLFPVEATFDVPSGWAACGSSSGAVDICATDNRLTPRNWSGRELSFLIVKNVVADPCDSTGRQVDPPVGPSVGDLVTAISKLPGFKVTALTNIDINGLRGQEFELTAPSNVTGGCLLRTWSSSIGTNDGINQVTPGEINLVRVLDVDGTRLMIAARYFPATTSSDELAEPRQVFESVRFEP